MNYKPMLAVDCGSVEALPFPLVVSPKMDGVRAIVTPTGLLSRALKPIPNVNVQALLAGLPGGLDGELIEYAPTEPDTYRRTVSTVMSTEKHCEDIFFYVFDIQMNGPWEERLRRVESIVRNLNDGVVKLVPQVTVNNLAELLEYEARWVGEGYEGLIARKPGSPYKHGRSTVREGYLLKVKRFVDGEAEVIGVTELMHNANEAVTNELGRTARSHKKAGMVPAGVMGTLQVRDVKTGVEFEIGTGFTADERNDLWKRWNGRGRIFPLAKYKHFPSGAKDKPRHPVFLGWRDRRDV